MSAIRKSAASPFPENVLTEMLVSLSTSAPSMKRQRVMKKSLLERVGKLVTEKNADIAAADMLIVRADEGSWITFAPSVAMKVLHDDGTTRSWLARFSPGGIIPAHMQTGDEEAIVMHGWCYLDGVAINCGDYHLIHKGARHGVIHSPEGCLIFVRSHSEKRHASELAAVR
jgi:quercetin dioxygenase-like cupin family protein